MRACLKALKAPRCKTKPEGLTVRFWQPGDTDGINRLYNDPLVNPTATTPGYTPRTSDQWTWEFASLSAETPAYTIATHDDRLVGVQAYIPIEMLHDGTLLLSGKDEDTLIHPDHRGMGVLDEMYRLLFSRAKQDSVAVLWGFTNTAVRPLVRNGYHSVGKFEAMRAELPCRRACHSGVTVQELEEPDERCDAFSHEFGRQVGGITSHLSERYLRWRLYDNPFRQYKIYAARENGRIVGLSAFKLEPKQPVGYVSELVAVPTASHTASEILGALLRPGLDSLHARGYRSAEARPSGRHPFNKTVRSVLSEHGFKDHPNRTPMELLVRPMVEDRPSLLDMANWRISEIMREY